MVTIWYVESVSVQWVFFYLCLHKIRESNTLNAWDYIFTDVNIGVLTVTLILMLMFKIGRKVCVLFTKVFWWKKQQTILMQNPESVLKRTQQLKKNPHTNNLSEAHQ